MKDLYIILIMVCAYLSGMNIAFGVQNWHTSRGYLQIALGTVSIVIAGVLGSTLR